MSLTVALWVGAGGFIGSVFRYLITVWLQPKVVIGFPSGTFLVNIAGCFLIGLLIGMTLNKSFEMNEQTRYFLSTGICGGFTTFSAFSAETFLLLQRGETGIALLYAGLSLIGGVLATMAGIFIFR